MEPSVQFQKNLDLFLPKYKVLLSKDYDSKNLKAKILSTSESDLAYAGSLLSKDLLVAFPTETVYGLGANACSEKAVISIFTAKSIIAKFPEIIFIFLRKAAQ